MKNVGKKQIHGLGTIKKYEFIVEQVNRAKDDFKFKKGILCKDFNLRSNTDEKWLDFEVINNEETFTLDELKGSYAIGGADLSSTTDLTCASLLILKNRKKYLLQQYFIPEECLDIKIKEDKVPYDIWKERGLVTVCDGARINYSDVTNWFYKMHQEFDISAMWIGYDPWGSQYWITEMQDAGFQMEKVIQGARTMSNPMKELEADLREKKLVYNNNPITKWCLLNTSIEIDKNDNIRPVKGRNNKERIDGTVSLIDAYCVLFEKMNDYIALQEV